MLTLLPPELLLEIIPHIPLDPPTLRILHLTSSHLHSLLTLHERPLVHSTLLTHLPPSFPSLFPSLPHPPTSFPHLLTLLHRHNHLSLLPALWTTTSTTSSLLPTPLPRWTRIHSCSLILLHRLHDAPSHPYRAALIAGLPAKSLAFLAFALVASIKILRRRGPDPIRESFAAGDVLARSDVELACEEMLLVHGPEFFFALVRAGERGEGEGEGAETRDSGRWAVDALTAEIAGMFERQMPCPDGFPRPPTLTSCLRRALAARHGCHIAENVGRMWEVLGGKEFDGLDERVIGKIVRGEEEEVRRKGLESGKGEEVGGGKEDE